MAKQKTTSKKKPTKPTKKPIIKPYKKDEFERFLELLKSGTALEHWQNFAEALGVSRDTINVWKDLPLAKKARATGLDRALEGMESAGSGDWRMWREKAKLLGADVVEKVDVMSGGKPIKQEPTLSNYKLLTIEQLQALANGKKLEDK